MMAPSVLKLRFVAYFRRLTSLGWMVTHFGTQHPLMLYGKVPDLARGMFSLAPKHCFVESHCLTMAW